MRPKITRLVLVVSLGFAGCDAYRAEPLPHDPNLETTADLASSRWTLADVVDRALRDNADLAALRTQRRVAKAQQLSAGLLADPSFSAAVLPLLAGPGSTLAWNAALSGDLRALVTLKARREGSAATTLEVDAQCLWQEWQIAAQARLLAVQLIQGEQALALLRQALALLANRSARLAAVETTGDVALSAIAPDLAALQAARSQADAAERLQLSRRHQLNQLLNREPDAALPLASTAQTPPFDLAAAGDLQALVRRRPDLIALRLGYRAQEARVRLAILMQFPAFSLGVAGGSDNSNVRNGGPQLAASLPLFDGNRGESALQKATRAQLKVEYQSRLNAASGQLRASISELAAAQAALSLVRSDLPLAERAMNSAKRALQAGDLDDLAYVDLATAYVSKRLEIAALEEAMLEQRLTIAAVIGAGLPSITALEDSAL